VIISTILAGSIAGIGMAASFHTVSLEMTPGFGRAWAWTVPATIDLAVASFSLLEVVLVRLSMPHLLARLAVYAATAATVYLNVRVANGHGHAQQLAHAAMPAIWVIYIELLRGAAKFIAVRERGSGRHSPGQWILAPRTTFTDWRQGVLEPAAGHGGQSGRGHNTANSRLLGRYTDNLAPGAQPTALCPPEDRDLAPDDPAFPTSRPPPGPGRGHSQHAIVLATATKHPDWTNAQIARHLNLSPRTVRRHRHGR
jgi:hypothetical protein